MTLYETLPILYSMRTLSVADLKAQFSSVITDLRNGKLVVITYGRNKEPLATIVPQSRLEQPDESVQLGDLKADGWQYKLHDFKITDEELLRL